MASVIAAKRISRKYKELLDSEDNEIYISLAANLHYPTVLVGWNGKILYKNRKVVGVSGKWRVGSNLKAYMDDEDFRNAMSVKRGEYTTFLIGNEEITVLRFDNYYFLVFMAEFEHNSAHVYSLYNYISNIPDKNFFVSRRLVPKENLSEEITLRCEEFKKRFEHFYRDVKALTEDMSFSEVEKTSEREHNLVNVLENLEDYINCKNFNFGCKFRKEDGADYFVNCCSKDLGVILGLLVFLALQCSSSRKPVLLFDFKKKEKPYSCRLSLSVRSSVTESEIEKYFHSEIIEDEKTLYFQTLKALASKYFWGVGIERKDEQIELFLKIVSCSDADSWFHDSSSYGGFMAVSAFGEFIRIIFGEDI